jgi:hypothetical protein
MAARARALAGPHSTSWSKARTRLLLWHVPVARPGLVAPPLVARGKFAPQRLAGGSLWFCRFLMPGMENLGILIFLMQG